MHPVLFTFRIPYTSTELAFHWYGLLLMLSFVLGTWLAMSGARRAGIPPRSLAEASLVCLLGGLVGARLLYVLQAWEEFARGPWWRGLAIGNGGLVFYGGLLGAIPCLCFHLRLRKVDLREALDLLAPSVALGLGIARIGCFLGGCCHGRPCSPDHFLAVTYPAGSAVYLDQVREGIIPPGGASVPVYAAPLLSSACNFLLFVALLCLLRRRPPQLRGLVVVAFLLLYPALRFGLEFVRGDAPRTHGLTPAQYVSLILLLTAAGAWLAVGVLTEIRRRPRRVSPESTRQAA